MSTPAGELNLSGILEPPATPQQAAHPARVISAPPRSVSARPTLPAAPHPHGAYDSLTEGSWSTGDAPKVKDWYRQTFNADLPVSAFGQSPTHDRMGLDHSQSMDVGLNPTTPEGQGLVSYLKQNKIPFPAYDRAVPGAATGPHIHVGSPSHGLRSQPSAPSLNLDGILESLNLDGILDPPADDDGEPVRTEAAVDRATGRALALSDRRRQLPVDASTMQAQAPPMPQLPQRQTFDPRTEAGRAARDQRARLERTPGAFLEVAARLPAEDRLSDSAAGGEMVRSAYVRALVSRGVPEAEAVKLVGSDYSLRNAKGEVVAPADAISDDNLDAAARTMRVRLDASHLTKLADAYTASKGTLTRVKDWAADETHSPGEKFLDVVTPPAQFALEKGGRGLDLATRPLQAIDAGFWAKVRGADNVLAVKAAYDQFFGDQPELGKNVIAEALRHSDRLRAINPRLPTLLGELTNIIVEPSNLIPAGALAKGAKALRGAEGAAELGRVGKLIEGAGGAAREAGLLDRGLVKARPLGLLEEAQSGLRHAVATEPTGGLGGVVEEAHVGVAAPDLHHSNNQPRAGTGQFVEGKPQPTHAPPQFTVDDALHQNSPYYDLDPQEVLSAALEGQRARLTELRRFEAATSRGLDPKTGVQLSPRRLKKLQGQVERLKAEVANGPALVRESFGDEAAQAFEKHASEGSPTEFTFDPQAGERGAVNISEIAAGVRKAASKETLLDLANVPRTLKASADLSAPLRQGAIFTLTEPRAAGRAMRAQLSAFASEGNFEQIAREIASHPDANVARKSGL